MDNFELKQENASLKEQLENEISSVNHEKQYNDVENDNLMLLQQKGNKIFTYKASVINIYLNINYKIYSPRINKKL